jgi:hypothetical protein
LEETATADNFAKDEIDYGNFSYSRSSPRLGAASGAEDDTMMVEVVVVFN